MSSIAQNETKMLKGGCLVNSLVKIEEGGGTKGERGGGVAFGTRDSNL